MKENIEEDIVLLNDFIEGKFQRDKLENYKGQYKMGYFYYKDIQQAIEHILSDYKRVLKENEELKEKWDKDTHILQNDLDIANAKKIELQKENEKLKKLITNKIGYTQQLEQDLYEKCSNYVIPKQKVKDKIEYINKFEEELYKRENIIQVLEELIEEE